MIRKTVLLAGVAAALLTAAPALAQDAAAPAAAPQTAPAAQGSLQLQPGSSVKGSDGSVLGTLEGVQTNASGEQELTVRGSDGDLRGVPLGGLTQEGADVVVGVSATEFSTAPVVEDAAPAPTGEAEAVPPAADPAADPTPSTAPADPMTADPMAADPMADDAAEPDGTTPPTPQG